jgi:predicted  nucleic acid-binding Zn-ribbon protein
MFTKKVKIQKNLLQVFLIIASFGLLFQPTAVVAQSLEEQLKEVEQQIKDIQNKKDQLQSQLDANTYLLQGYSSQLSQLYGEAQIYKDEISLLEKQIVELEISMKLLDKQISETKEDIKNTEVAIADLEKESNQRIRNGYMSYRLYGSQDAAGTFFHIEDVNIYFKDSQYKEIIQSETNDLMNKVTQLKQQLMDKKEELNNKLAKVREEQEVIEIKKDDLDKKNAELEVRMAAYYDQVNRMNLAIYNGQQGMAVFEEEEAYKRAEAEKIKQEIFNSFNPIGNGQFVLAGTMMGQQGSTGFSTGAHLHFSVIHNGILVNPCGYLPAGVVSGCGGGNSLEWPLRSSTIWYTSAFGQRCFWWNGGTYCDFHDAIDIAGDPWNTPVYAAHNGYLYKGVDGYGALYIILCETTNCNVGFKTGYWHLSSY